jgi:anthranilate phosphoribosyltransferase
MSENIPYSVNIHLESLLSRRDLTPESAGEIMQAVIAGRVGAASVASLAVALRAKGESVGELAAFARVMRAAAVPVCAPAGTLDTCGTGGDKSDTFNISTATALVVAGMGIPVAKHGGRSVTSASGSVDVLKELGVNLDASPAVIERCIREAGIGFLFAQAHHPGMKHVAPVRRELGIRTIFNLLGPLSNPAGAKLQLLGVFDPSLCETFAAVLSLLGTTSAIVACGTGCNGGYLDEVSTFGPTRLARLRHGKINVEEFDAQSLGLPRPPAGALSAASPAASAKIIRSVLAGERGYARDIVVLNAAAAALVANKATEWTAALQLAGQSINAGRAATALARLVEVSHISG